MVKKKCQKKDNATVIVNVEMSVFDKIKVLLLDNSNTLIRNV